MNLRHFAFPLLTLPVVSTLAGEPDFAKSVILPEAHSPWRIGGGYAQMLGLKAEFSGLGKFGSAFTLQPLGSGIQRDYDNGYVYLDSSQNEGGLTWNWSYDNAAQYNPSGTGSIDYSITNSFANGRSDDRGAAEPGVELFAYYDMGSVNLTALRDLKVTWGFRGGLQYSRINLGSQSSVSTQFRTTTDQFDLGGVIAPLAPYTGSFGGPGPLLGDAPTRSSTVRDTGLVSGDRDLDVDLTIITAGSYLAMPVTSKLDFFVEAGVSLGLAHGSYDFNSETTITGVGTQQSSGNESSTDILPGVYVGLGTTYQITDHFSLIGSGRYQYMSSFDLETNGSKASLSFDSAFILSIGGVYSF